jgi:hypothetical protein
MEKEFIPYKQALELKELGFDEPCFGYYYHENSFTKCRPQIYYSDTFTECNRNEEIPLDSCNAPLYQQAFRWFREKFGLRASITDFIDDKTGIEWDYEIAVIGTDLDENGNYKPLVDYSTDDENRKFKTYEEAELACLIKLIEILKEQKL